MKKNLLLPFLSFLFIISCNQPVKVDTVESNIQPKVEQKKSNNIAKTNVYEDKKIYSKNILSEKKQEKRSIVEEARIVHEKYLANNPFKKTFNLSKTDRKAFGLPPNKYFEQEWVMEMNPYIGRPTGENLSTIRKEIEDKRIQDALQRIPGDGADNNWVERGPNNVGGRTRAILFDPTDTNSADGITVVAGGVSGGLWKNTNIGNASTSWSKMDLPEHLNVQTITVDPNNNNIWYVGTGETYVFGDVNGNGLWKSLDAGRSWFQVLGGGSVTSIIRTIKRLDIISPSIAITIGAYTTGLPTFGNSVITPITASIALVNDGTAPTDDACSALPASSMSGKIALIRRGSCSFESKVLMAQNAGAVAVIIMNNVAGGGVINMAGDGAGATIPSVMISKEDGDLLVANLTNLTGTIKPAVTGEFSGTEVQGVQVINDVAIKNNGGISEIFVAIGDGYYGGIGAATYFSPSTYGVYKSVDGGSTWSKLNLPLTANSNQTCPNDIEIGIDGKIWVSSTNSWTFGDGGGKVFGSSNGGNTFTLAHTVTGNGGGSRVQIEASGTNPNKIYILSELDQAVPTSPTIEVKLEMTTNAFGSVSTLTLPPATGETRLTTYGFTGQQAFYDLVLESDPTNDAIIVAGGINLAKSTNSGSSWTQISAWSGGNNLHSDQHAIVFNPNNTNMVLFGNDGGVYYCGSLSTATNSSANITSRNSGFNVTQFVGVAVMPGGIAGTTGDFFVAGAQDNGSNYSGLSAGTTTGAVPGINPTFEVQGGDGGIPLFSQSSNNYYITNYVYNGNMVKRSVGSTATKSLETTQNGLFYPAMALDSNLNIVYSEFTDTAVPTYQIRRISNFLGGPAPTKASLSNALLTSYPTALKVSPFTTTSTKLYVGTMNSKLLRVTTANSFAAWTDISGPDFIGSVSDIEFGANENQIFVTFHNYGVTNIWYTPNGGTNWYSLEGNLPDLPVKTILQNPLAPNELMIGTDLGVWYANDFNSSSTSNQALNWRQAYNGMSNVKVTDLDLQPNSPTAPTAYSVYAATYGRGVFSADLWYCGSSSTTWNGSTWSNGVPTAKTAVIFAGNYSSTGNLDACSVVVNTGRNVIFNSNHTLRVGDNVTVNGTGTLTFENNSGLIQFAKHAVNSGNIVVKRNSATMVRQDYTAWASPVQNQQLLAFSPNTLTTRFYQYLYTGTTTPTAYQSIAPTNNFQVGKGYVIRSADNWPTTPTVYNGIFTGVPNNGINTISIGKGYNVIGNPYPSPISADEFIKKNARVRTLYYWTHTAPASGGVYPINNFASYTLLGGTASAAGGSIPNNKIQVGQGFYVSSLDAFSVEFNNEMRVDASTTSQFFRNENSSENNEEKHRIWLNLNSSSEAVNQILIGYMNGASNNVDETIDGLMLDNSKSMIYNYINDKEYVIQGRQMPFTDEDIVPLGFKTLTTDTFTLSLETFDGLFDNQDIFIKDNFTNTVHNLKNSNYQFSSNIGTFNNRFELVYKSSVLSQDEISIDNTLSIYTNQNQIKVSSSNIIKEVIVYDVLGRTVIQTKNINSKEYTSQSIEKADQTLIVKVYHENGSTSTKKIIH